MHPLCIFASFCSGFSPEKERGIYGRKGRGRRDGRKCGERAVRGAVVSLATRWQRRRLRGTRGNVRGRIKKRKPGTRRFVSFRLICTG